MNIETKNIDIKLLGRNGIVNANCMQRHLQTSPMILISTSSGSFMVCQSNHPLIINRDNFEIVIDACDVQLTDRIYVNNNISALRHDDANHIDPSVELEDLVYGDIYTYRLPKEFINYSYDFLNKIIEKYKNESNIIETTSYNFASQIKVICDILDIRCELTDVFKTPEYNLFILSINEYLPANIVSDLSEISNIFKIDKWFTYVYDIKTNTSEFLSNGVQTHNSFHSGGTADLSRVNILNELISNIESKYEASLKSMVSQVENDLITLSNNTSIIIDRSIYIDKNQLKITPTEIILPLGYFTLNIGNMTVPITSEKPAIIYQTSDYEEIDNKLIIKYKINDKIAKFEPLQLKANEIARYIDTLVGGGSPWTTPESLFMKFFNTLQHFSDWDSVHLEVVISTILRNKENPQIPARLKEPYNPSTHSVKNLPSLISWPLGLGFENFGKSITYGMISDRADPSEIEKVLSGEPLSDLSVELIKKAAKERKK